MTTTRNILKAQKLNHFTAEDVHTDSQRAFVPSCNSRRIYGYVVPQGHTDYMGGTVQVTCPRCLKTA